MNTRWLAILVALICSGPLDCLARARATVDLPSCHEFICAEIRGRVQRAGHGTVVDAAEITIFPTSGEPRGTKFPQIPEAPPWMLHARSDGKGEFKLSNVPEGEAWLIVAADGYRRFAQRIEVRERLRTRSLRIHLDEDPNFQYRTVVDSSGVDPRGRAVGRHYELDTEFARQLPGALDDPLRALQVLPGVARPPGGLSLLAVRGMAPNQVTVEFAGQRVPRAHHLLGLSSIVATDALESVRLDLGDVDPSRSGGVAGTLVLEPRRGRRDGLHGRVSVDLLRSAVMAEGPLARGSFLVSARRAYLDLVLQPIYRKYDGTGLPLPSYHDALISLRHPLARRSEIRLDVLGTGDRVRREIPDARRESGFRTITQLRQQMWQGSLALIHRRQATTWRASLATRIERDDFSYESWSGEHWGRAGRRMYLSPKLEFEASPLPWMHWSVGVDGEFRQAKHHGSGYVGTSTGSEDAQSQGRLRSASLAQGDTVTQWRTIPAAFVSTRLEFRPWQLELGVRSQAHRHGDDWRLHTQPRAALTFEPHPSWRATAMAGIYVQPYEHPEKINEILFGTGLFPTGDGIIFLPETLGEHLDPAAILSSTPPLHPIERGRKVSVSFGYDSRGHLPHGPVRIRLQSTGYALDISSGAAQHLVETTRNLQWTRGQRAMGVGLENSIRVTVGSVIETIASYSLARSEQIAWSDAGAPTRAATDFDQRHIFSAAFVARLAHAWTVGLRYRYATGLPFTPIVLAIRKRDHYNGLRGATNSERLPPSHQLDLRLEKAWTVRRTRGCAYLDIQNLLNAPNAEGWLMSRDLERRLDALAMPILPSLGLSWAW